MTATAARLNVTVGDRVRWAQVWRPAESRGAPLVVDLHGSGFDPHRHARVTATPAWAGSGAVVVVPCAAIPLAFDERAAPGWAWAVPGAPLYGHEDVAEPAGVDDVAFLDALVTTARHAWHVDTDRTFALGYSGGARMLSHWVGSSAHIVTAACCVSGVRSPASKVATKLLAMHGVADSINPPEGSTHPRWRESVDNACRAWATALGCSTYAGPASGDGRDGFDEHRWDTPDGAAGVRLLSLRGGGHAWPGTRDPEHIALFGAPADIDATGLAASFFGLANGSGLSRGEPC